MRRYRVSGLVNQVFHGNGVTDTQTVGTTNWLAKQERRGLAGRLVVEGRLAKELFASEKAVHAFGRLGYTFKKLADGTIVLTRAL